MEVVLLGLVVVGPDAVLGVGEDDLCLRLVWGFVGPHVEVSELGGSPGAGGAEPRMAVRGVVDDEVDDDPQPTVLGCAYEGDEVAERTEPTVDAVVVGDVVAVVAVRRGLEWHQPDAADA